jgi:heme/copper-type cytochrome/quinol oxidase subunit 2
MQQVRRILLGGPASVVLIVLMLAGCLFLWVGVPVLWLWIGSQLQGSVELGTALMVTIVGAIGTIVCVAPLLVRLNRRHVELREARGLPIGENSPLEVMLVVSAVIAMVGGAVWFFGFSGSSPVPLNLSY